MSSSLRLFLAVFLTTALAGAANEQTHPPETEKWFPSQIAPVQEIAVTLSSTNFEMIRDLAAVLAEKNKKEPSKAIQLRVFYPESFEPLADQMKSTSATELENLKKSIEQKTDKNFADQVKYHAFNYLQFPWINDLGESFWIREKEGKDKKAERPWKRSFVDLNPGNRRAPASSKSKWPLDSKAIFESSLPLEEPQFLRDSLRTVYQWESTQLPVVVQDIEFSSLGNRGSNLIILPEGTALVGSSAPSEMKTLLETLTGKKVLVADTEFMDTKNISYLFNVVPSNNPCGYTLLKTDVVWGAELAKLGHHKNSHKNNKYSAFVNEKIKSSQKQIDAGAEMLAKHLKETKACENLATITLPVLPVVPDFEEYTEAMREDYELPGLRLSTPSTAFLNLNGSLVLSNFAESPQKFRKNLRELTLKQLEKAGYSSGQIHFIQPPGEDENAGGLRNAALVLRAGPMSVSN
ncbi:MAG: hypothetical protein ABS42_00425 [Bdellovibrio sp. SCN 50-8]|nr:MAG: hypothetical protein ABS42_00425 [Bdellovibrio sp. SCN 50-8]